jgi:hypothetical protein
VRVTAKTIDGHFNVSVGHGPRHPHRTSVADLRAVPAGRQLEHEGQGRHRSRSRHLPSRSSRCTAVASGSNRRLARGRPSDGVAYPRRVSEEGSLTKSNSPIQHLQNLARISQRILRSALWVSEGPC